MENIRLTFSSEEVAIQALKQIWIDIVKDEVTNNKVLAKSETGQFFDDISSLDDFAIGSLKLCGHINGKFVFNNGTTTAFGEAQKCYNIEKWHIPKPPEKYMINLVSYAEEPYDTAWEFPDEI